MYLWSSLPGFCIKLHNYVYIEFLSILSKLCKLHTYYANKINYAWIECHPTKVNYVKQVIFLAAYNQKHFITSQWQNVIIDESSPLRLAISDVFSSRKPPKSRETYRSHAEIWLVEDFAKAKMLFFASSRDRTQDLVCGSLPLYPLHGSKIVNFSSIYSSVQVKVIFWGITPWLKSVLTWL